MIYLCSADVGDTGAEFDRGFLQELRDLKVFVNDKEIVDEHRRFVWQLCTKFAVAFFFQESCFKSQGNGLQDGPQTILTARTENFTVFLGFWNTGTTSVWVELQQIKFLKFHEISWISIIFQ